MTLSKEQRVMTQMKRIFNTIIILLISTTLMSQDFIHLNQVGYPATATKQALVTNLTDKTFFVKEAVSHNDVMKGTISSSKFWRESNENISWADFSSLRKPGKYFIKIGTEKSETFEIQDNSKIYDDLLQATVRSFYYWRSGMDLLPDYATWKGVNYSRKAGHNDSIVYLHASLTSAKRPADTELNSHGGWYDAGDYAKYTTNAGITLHTLLTSYITEQKQYDTLSFNIPESNNSTPDILDEAMYELKWLLTMQDPNDGGVYNKVTALKFPGFIMPADDKADRYMIGKTIDVAYNFAATMALASRVFEGNTDYPEFSEKAKKAAIDAFKFASKHTMYRPFVNPPDCNTGTYDSESVEDERFWASCELLILTGDKKYADNINLFQIFNVPYWGDVATLGLISLMLNRNAISNILDENVIEKRFKALADNLLAMYNYQTGRVPLREYEWGSNGQVANSGMILALGKKVLKADKYTEAAQYCLDYILGCNSTGYCFVTGFGSLSPLHIHDRRCSADGIESPIPGYMVGGPNVKQTTDCGREMYPTNRYAARAYLDEECSYSTNEPAINWNAPLVFLTAFVRGEYK